MDIREGVFDKIAKIFAKWQFKKVVKQIQKEFDRDPEIQQITKDLNTSYTDLEMYIDNLCYRDPKNPLCKDWKPKKK